MSSLVYLMNDGLLLNANGVVGDRNDETKEALKIVKQFHTMFPPSALKKTSAPISAYDSTRVVLTIPSPSSATKESIAPPLRRPLLPPLPTPLQTSSSIPPILTFADVEVLHQRLVREEDGRGVRWLGWIVRSYVGVLRGRRMGGMSGGVKKEGKDWEKDGKIEERRDEEVRMGKRYENPYDGISVERKAQIKNQKRGVVKTVERMRVRG